MFTIQTTLEASKTNSYLFTFCPNKSVHRSFDYVYTVSTKTKLV